MKILWVGIWVWGLKEIVKGCEGNLFFILGIYLIGLGFVLWIILEKFGLRFILDDLVIFIVFLEGGKDCLELGNVIIRFEGVLEFILFGWMIDI